MSAVTEDEIAVALDSAGDTRPGAARPGRGHRAPARSWQDAFADRTVAVEDGHLHWCGTTAGISGTPVVTWHGQVETAYRLAFRWHYGREPEGTVRPACDYPCCVAGEHLADRLIREGATA